MQVISAQRSSFTTSWLTFKLMLSEILYLFFDPTVHTTSVLRAYGNNDHNEIVGSAASWLRLVEGDKIRVRTISSIPIAFTYDPIGKIPDHCLRYSLGPGRGIFADPTCIYAKHIVDRFICCWPFRTMST